MFGMMTHSAEGTLQAAASEGKLPLLSVTVLNYNYARYLSQCLDSILRQTCTDFELILINDCSTDNSLEVIQPYLADPRVRLINHAENRGYISSLIEGSNESRGKYLTVISADDFCISDRAFETLLGMMEADADVAFGYCAFGAYGDDGARMWLSRPHAESYVRTGAEEYRDLAVANYILHSGLIIRKTAYVAVGGYNPTATYACDIIMWLMLCTKGKVAYSADELYAYRRHGSNMSFTTSGVQATLKEQAFGIRQSFVIMNASHGIPRDVYVRAMKQTLSYRAVEYVFAGHLMAAWLAFWCAVRVDPLLAICQKQTLALIARTLLGSRGYRQLEKVRHPRRTAALNIT